MSSDPDNRTSMDIAATILGIVSGIFIHALIYRSFLHGWM